MISEYATVNGGQLMVSSWFLLWPCCCACSISIISIEAGEVRDETEEELTFPIAGDVLIDGHTVAYEYELR